MCVRYVGEVCEMCARGVCEVWVRCVLGVFLSEMCVCDRCVWGVCVGSAFEACVRCVLGKKIIIYKLILDISTLIKGRVFILSCPFILGLQFRTFSQIISKTVISPVFYKLIKLSWKDLWWSIYRLLSEIHDIYCCLLIVIFF